MLEQNMRLSIATGMMMHFLHPHLMAALSPIHWLAEV